MATLLISSTFRKSSRSDCIRALNLAMILPTVLQLCISNTLPMDACLNQQMVVVVHQAVGADAKAKQLDSLMQYFDKTVIEALRPKSAYLGSWPRRRC
jgi:hypothetical protein